MNTLDLLDVQRSQPGIAHAGGYAVDIGNHGRTIHAALIKRANPANPDIGAVEAAPGVDVHPGVLRKMPKALVAYVVRHLAHGGLPFLQQAQRLGHTLLPYESCNAHARACTKITLEIALVGAYSARQLLDGEVFGQLRPNDVNGLIHGARLAPL